MKLILEVSPDEISRIIGEELVESYRNVEYVSSKYKDEERYHRKLKKALKMVASYYGTEIPSYDNEAMIDYNEEW